MFQSNLDLSYGGVLTALPALLSNGLFHSTDKYFSLPSGYYSFSSIILSLSFGSLLRAKTLEQLRYFEPGELGKLIGMDRIPEVKTLREKVKELSSYSNILSWQKELSQFWMQEHQSEVGVLYIDGHVRVYHGHQTPLPKRYVSREKLCLRGVTDYWVNDSEGLPFFVITKEINTGLIEVLKSEIIPRLLLDVPNQPSDEALEADPQLFRFILVFDREGFSYDLFQELWKLRIAACTYRKNVKEEWPVENFIECKYKVSSGEIMNMKIAEEKQVIKQANNLELREVRRLTDTGRQISIITKDFKNSPEKIAYNMSSRWSQENFFKYMKENYGIDKLFSYKLTSPEELNKSLVVNPGYRKLESEIRSFTTLLDRQKIKFAEIQMKEPIEKEASEKYIRMKSEKLGEVKELEQKLEELKTKKKKMNKKIEFKDLPEGEQFNIFKKSDKQFLDTIKMISYRAETALANTIADSLSNKDEARSLIKQIFQTSADIEVSTGKNILEVKLHSLSTPKNNEHLIKLCEVLNTTETIFPGTNLKLIYKLGST